MSHPKTDQPTNVRPGEELDGSKLEPFLLQHLPDSEPPLVISQFPSGFSNLTYQLSLGGQTLVLRRPPFGNQVKSAHDMGREYNVLSRLSSVFALAPKPYLFCDDASILGDQFYVMERKEGVILRGADPVGILKTEPASVSKLCESFVDGLAQLHLLDFKTAGLAEIGKPDGYGNRQIDGWTARYEKAKTDDWPDMEQLAIWLDQHRPQSTYVSLVHNDFKYDNLLLDPTDLTRITGVLDWEMSTLGDPLFDLGSALAYWIESNDSPQLQRVAFGPTMIPGSWSRQQIVDHYVEKTKFEIGDPIFYYCFGLFKLAVIVQQIYARYAKGLTQDKRFAHLNQIVGLLGNAATTAIESDRISL